MWNKVVQVGHLFPLFHPAHIGDDDDDDYADYKDGDHDNDHEDGDYNEDDLDDLFSFSPCVNSR